MTDQTEDLIKIMNLLDAMDETRAACALIAGGLVTDENQIREVASVASTLLELLVQSTREMMNPDQTDPAQLDEVVNLIRGQ